MARGTITVDVGASELLVETVPVVGTQHTSLASDAVESVREAFVRAQTAIVDVAASTVEAIEAAGRRAAQPDTMEVEFGLRFTAQGNVIVAGTAGEATLRVKLAYNRTAAPAAVGAASSGSSTTAGA